LLLLDLSMPQQTGIEAFASWDRWARRVRIILLTARWKRARSSEALQLGAARRRAQGFSNTDFDPGRCAW